MLKLILILFMAWACKKPEPLPSKPPMGGDQNSSKLELVWRVPMSAEEKRSEGRQPLMYAGDLICNSAPFGQGFSIWRLDGETGEKKWEWNNFLKYPTLQWANHQFIYNGKYAFHDNNETNVIDLNSGNSSWQFLVADGYGQPGITRIGEYLYHKHTSLEWPPEIVYLLRTPVTYMKWDTIFSMNRDSLDSYSPFIHGPILWMSPSNDSILVFQNRSYRFGANQDGQIDLYAYNLSKKKIEFILEDIEPTGNSNALPPVIDNNRAYVLGNRNLHCIDLVNRKILWQKGFPGFGHHLMLSNLVIDGDRLIVKPDNDAIYAMNKHTGDLIWNTYEAGHSPSHMQFHDGIVYYTAEGDGKLFAVKTSNGEIIWQEDSPHDGVDPYYSAGFQNGVAINEELGYIYAQDQYFMMCFKLPK